MKKQNAIMETSFWILGHRTDILSYLFRFFTVHVPEVVRQEILASDPRYPQRVYGYQETFTLLKNQDMLAPANPTQPVSQFHAGEAAAIGLAIEKNWWLLINEQRALLFARQQGIKSVTIPEFVIYLYERQILSYRSTHNKLEILSANTGQHIMQAAWQTFRTLAQTRSEG